MWGKDDGSYDSLTSWDESPDFMKNKRVQRIPNKKRGQRSPPKNERKRDKGQSYYPFTTLVLQSSTMIFMIESLLCCHFHILVGIFHYRTWHVYSNDGLPQNALNLREQASWMHTHLVSFVELSYIYSSSASVAWQSLLLALTSIDGHLHSSLISLVDVRLSPFLSSPHNPHHHILFHP